MPLLLLLPLKPQSCVSVVKNVKQRIISVGGMASAGGLIRKEKLLSGILLFVLLVTSKGVYKGRRKKYGQRA